MTIGDKAPSQDLPLPLSGDILRLAKKEFAVSRNTQELFFNQAGLDLDQTHKFTETALHGSDDGELFLEYTLSEAFSFDDNRLKAASFDTSHGFGLRAVNGEAVGFAHATDLSMDARCSAPRPACRRCFLAIPAHGLPARWPPVRRFIWMPIRSMAQNLPCSLTWRHAGFQIANRRFAPRTARARPQNSCYT